MLEFYWLFVPLLSFVIHINNLTTVFLFFNQSPPEVHANVAETLCTITRVASSSTLAIKLSSPRFCLAMLYFFLTRVYEVITKFVTSQFCCKSFGLCIGGFTFEV